jgi:hypothetical protein
VTLTVHLDQDDSARPDYQHFSRGSILNRNPNRLGQQDRALLAAVGPTSARCFLRWEHLTTGAWDVSAPTQNLQFSASPAFSLTTEWLTGGQWANSEELVITQEGLIDCTFATVNNSWFAASASNRKIFEDLQYAAFRHYKLLNPQMRWVGCLNEPNITPNGGFNGANVYRLLKTAIEAVRRVNAEDLPGPALKVLGPETTFNFVEPQNQTGNDNSRDFVTAIVADAAWWYSIGKPNMGGLTLHSFNNNTVPDRLVGNNPARGFAKFDALATEFSEPNLFAGIPRIVTAYSREDNGSDPARQVVGDGKGNDEPPGTLMMAQQAAFFAAWHELAHRYVSATGDRVEYVIMFSRTNYVDYSTTMVRPIPLNAAVQLNWPDGARTPVYNVAALEARIASNSSAGVRRRVVGNDPAGRPIGTVGSPNGQVMTATAVTQPGVGKVWLLLARVQNGSTTNAAGIDIDWDALGTALNLAGPVTVDAWRISRSESMLAPVSGLGGELTQIIAGATLAIPTTGLPRTTVAMEEPSVVLVELTGTPVTAPPPPPPPQAPSVTIAGPTSATTGVPVGLTAVNSGGPVSTWAWSASGAATPPSSTAAGYAPSWAVSGPQTVTVTATGAGGTSTATTTIQVTTVAPPPGAGGGLSLANLGVRWGAITESSTGGGLNTFVVASDELSQNWTPRWTMETLERTGGQALILNQCRAYEDAPNRNKRFFNRLAERLPGDERLKIILTLPCVPNAVRDFAVTNGMEPIEYMLSTDPADASNSLGRHQIRRQLDQLAAIRDAPGSRLDFEIRPMHEHNLSGGNRPGTGLGWSYRWNRHDLFREFFAWVATEAHERQFEVSWCLSVGPVYSNRFNNPPEPGYNFDYSHGFVRWPGAEFVDVLDLDYYAKHEANRDTTQMLMVLDDWIQRATAEGISWGSSEWASGAPTGVCSGGTPVGECPEIRTPDHPWLLGTLQRMEACPQSGAGSMKYAVWFSPRFGGNFDFATTTDGNASIDGYYDLVRTGRITHVERHELMRDTVGWLSAGKVGPAPFGGGSTPPPAGDGQALIDAFVAVEVDALVDVAGAADMAVSVAISATPSPPTGVIEMTALTNIGEDLFLNWLLTTGSATRPNQWHVRLHVGNPGEDGTSNPATNAVRQSVVFNSASGGTTTNQGAIQWTNVPAPETYTAISIWNASTGGQPLLYGLLTQPRTVEAGDTFTIPAGSFTVTAD